MEIIPLIPERDVAIQRAWAVQDRNMRIQVRACLLLGRYYYERSHVMHSSYSIHLSERSAL